MRLVRRSIPFVWALLSLAGAALANVTTLPASRDTTLFEPLEDKANGAGEYLFAGNTKNGEARRALLAFDLSSIPAGSTINSVTLELRMNRTLAGAEDASLHRVTVDWGEGNSIAGGNGGGDPDSATQNDATWTVRFYDENTPENSPLWSSPGGDFVGSASDTASVDGNGFYTWSSAQMAADVQGWLDGANGNFGWILIGNEGADQTAKRFQSRENGQSPPQLEIDFTPPPVPGACCAENGSCSEVLGTACSGGSVFLGEAFSCSPTNPCPTETGRCCDDAGGCTLEAHPGGTCSDSYTHGGLCDPNTCPILTGACCTPDFTATCTPDVTEAVCTGGGGVFQGAATSCTPNPCPVVLTPFVDALPLPAVANPRTGTTDVYDIAMRETQQQLHRDLPTTTVWGYGDGPTGATYPGPTIEARSGQPITVNWINDLRDTSVGGTPLRSAHYLNVDTCPHGADDQSPRTVVHLHGGHVPSEFDGQPEDTFLPGEMDTYVYPNDQQASPLWYHDHALGITRLNVMMGLAGLYVIRDDVEDALSCDPVTPGVDPCLPAGPYEIPLVIQDRKFQPDGSLEYPSDWQDMFLGDTVLVNGVVWPFLDVDQGKYRLRLLNGSNTRTYTLSLSTGAPFQVVGQEGGLFPAPVMVSEVTLGSAERADVVVDFAPYAPGTEVFLVNSAPAPFPGQPGVGVIPDVMKFVVQAQAGLTNAVPPTLRGQETLQEADAVVSRSFELKRDNDDPCTGIRWEVISTDGLNGPVLGRLWEHVSEFPELGTTEIWSFVNRSGMMHPMHMHLVFFQVLDRETFSVVNGDVVPSGVRVPPPPEESGWKDTVQVGANEIVRVIARFEDYTGLFPYHCHILEHEDHEMMRQFQTVQCGNAVLEPGEECDDGNPEVGDGCTPDCELEDSLLLYGIGEGGSVSLDVDAVPIAVATSAGDDAFLVASAIADAINADPTLVGLGVSAFANGRRVVTNGAISNVVITDPGLGAAPRIPVVSPWGLAVAALLIAAGGFAARTTRRRSRPSRV